MRMFVSWKVTRGICLIAIQEYHSSLDNGQTADDAILGFLHLPLTLVVLRLREGAFLEGSELEFVARVQVELAGEEGICGHEGIDVSSDDELVSRKGLFQLQQIFLEIGDLLAILFRLGTEMNAAEDVVIRADNGNTLCPAQILLLFLIDKLRDLSEFPDGGKGLLIEQDKRILPGINRNKILFVSQTEIVKQDLGVLLNEEDICLKGQESAHELVQFSFLIEKTNLIEGFQALDEDLWVVFDDLFEFFVVIDEGQQGMIHDEIIQSNSFTLLFFPFELKGSDVLLKLQVPLLFKGLASDEAFPKNAYLHIKHVRITPLLEVFFDVTHLPLEFGLVEIAHVARDEFVEEKADGVEFGLVLPEVEFEGAESYTTVIESGHSDVAFAGDCGFFNVGERVQAIAHIEYKTVSHYQVIMIISLSTLNFPLHFRPFPSRQERISLISAAALIGLFALQTGISPLLDLYNLQAPPILQFKQFAYPAGMFEAALHQYLVVPQLYEFDVLLPIHLIEVSCSGDQTFVFVLIVSGTSLGQLISNTVHLFVQQTHLSCKSIDVLLLGTHVFRPGDAIHQEEGEELINDFQGFIEEVDFWLIDSA